MSYSTTFLQLCDSQIELRFNNSALAGLQLLKLHDDEQTCRRASLQFIGEYGGSLSEIINGQQRCISFSCQGSTYTIDPNRIFSEAGIAATLLEYSGTLTPAAVEGTRLFAESLLQAFRVNQQRPVIAVHNNTEGEYSIESYINSTEAAALFINPYQCVDDFFYVTWREAYDFFADKGFNCVLQHPVNMVEDGSLSVWMEHHRLPYINIEAMHGHQAQQLEMLLAVHEFVFQHYLPGQTQAGAVSH